MLIFIQARHPWRRDGACPVSPKSAIARDQALSARHRANSNRISQHSLVGNSRRNVTGNQESKETYQGFLGSRFINNLVVSRNQAVVPAASLTDPIAPVFST